MKDQLERTIVSGFRFVAFYQQYKLSTTLQQNDSMLCNLPAWLVFIEIERFSVVWLYTGYLSGGK